MKGEVCVTPEMLRICSGLGFRVRMRGDIKHGNPHKKTCRDNLERFPRGPK